MLTSEMLRRAADLSDEIAAKQAELDQILAGQIPAETNSAQPAPRAVATTTGKRRFSPEAIEKIRMAQRRRWKATRKAQAAAEAAVKAQQTVAAAPAPTAPATPAPAAPAAPAPQPAATPAPVAATA